MTLIAELDDGEVVFLVAPGIIPTILPPPDNFHVVKKNDTSITVQWKPPRDRNDIDRYILGGFSNYFLFSIKNLIAWIG